MNIFGKKVPAKPEKPAEPIITKCPYKGCGMSSTSVRHVQQHMKITHGG